MEIVLDVVTWVLLLTGSFFAVVGGIGIVRLPDFYTRLHGGGITGHNGGRPDTNWTDVPVGGSTWPRRGSIWPRSNS